MHSRFFTALAAAGIVVSAASVRAAEWTAPKDGVFTEKQLVAEISVMKEYMQMMKAAGKAAEGTSGAGGFILLGRTNAKYKEIIAKNGLQESEHEWLTGQVMQAWSTSSLQDMVDHGKADVAASIKKNQEELKTKQATLAVYEKALKEGKRVLTKEERESLMKSAAEDQQSALEEAKQHAEEAKAAREEADKADAEAKQNDALAKSPPADVSADDRPGYIDEKKAAAQSARDAAKEARQKETEALKARADSAAKGASAVARAKSPEVPSTEEEKAQTKQRNEDMIKQLKDDIETTQGALKLMNDQEQGETYKQLEAEIAKIPAPNRALMKKHRAEWEDAMGIKKN